MPSLERTCGVPSKLCLPSGRVEPILHITMMSLPPQEPNCTLDPQPRVESTLLLQPRASCIVLLHSKGSPSLIPKGVCMRRTTCVCLSVPTEVSRKPITFSQSNATLLVFEHECLQPSLTVYSLECTTFHPRKHEKTRVSLDSVGGEFVHV
mmetsp:Transcript_8120/g.28801  ORF Transcript_8120/g.28801 Transcript_8120/m.28801 type:complete len:151 (+) Transcript_8120:297-749(+)